MRNFLIVLVIALIGWIIFAKFIKPVKVAVMPTPTVPYAGKVMIDKANAAKTASNIEQVNTAVRSFYATEARNPSSLQELVEKQYMDRIPAGVNYDPSTGRVY
jgi:hypothetical protein